ncbi:sugar MFS transporter [Deinococcus sp. QL22]|uniref:MFS transporter n=1 Tax=Deinococcus sp. QL22 TaxID=2939437 RepID=UPI0020179199|nr:MFS transporter [Deinococcus sp. QL22]UQN05764.1 MFS transporter [Deinococcus sp. QL22]
MSVSETALPGAAKSVRLSLPLLGAGAAAFFTLGVIQAMYGPAFAFFQTRFDVGTAAVGWIASVHFLGSALAPPLTGVALTRFSLRRVVVSGLLILAAGVSLVGFAPLWNLALAGALVGGLGLGTVSAALNAAYASVGTRAVNLVNAVFGLGSIAAPLVVAGLAPRSLALPFLVVAALSALTLGLVRLWGVPAMQVAPAQAVAARPGVQFGLFAALIAAYVGLEAGFGAWLARHLDGVGLAGSAFILSGFWAGLTLGRIITGAVGARVSPPRLVLASAVLVALCALGASSTTLAPFAYLLAGLGLGPIFGTTLAWMTHTLPARLIPFLLVAGSAGGILMPILLGILYSRSGPAAVPAALAVLGAVLVALVAATARLTRLRPAAPAGC